MSKVVIKFLILLFFGFGIEFFIAFCYNFCSGEIMKPIAEKILDKKYFIFDIDGTLIDSMSMWSFIDQYILFEKFGITASQEDLKIFRDSVIYNDKNIYGDIYMIYYEELIKLFNLDVSAYRFQEMRNEILNYLSIYELDYKLGADKFLNLIAGQGKKIAVATTTTYSQYEIYENKNQNLIKKAPLKKLIDVAVLCEDVKRKKPDPEAYLLAMKKLGAKPEECIVFEDSLNGIISAKDAGVEVCAIYDDSAKNEQDIIEKIADYKVESFDELVRILEPALKGRNFE